MIITQFITQIHSLYYVNNLADACKLINGLESSYAYKNSTVEKSIELNTIEIDPNTLYSIEFNAKILRSNVVSHLALIQDLNKSYNNGDEMYDFDYSQNSEVFEISSFINRYNR